MRVHAILLAVTATVLASAKGVSTAGAVDLAKLATTSSAVFQIPTVADRDSISVQRRLRKHETVHDGSELDQDSTTEERVFLGGIERLPSLSKVDEIDDMIKVMTKGNALKEADGIDDMVNTIARSNALREADEIDAKIGTMLAGKSLQEAEELYAGLKAMLSPVFKNMADQGYTPQKVKSDIENKRIPGLTDEEAVVMGQLFPVYWKSVYG